MNPAINRAMGAAQKACTECKPHIEYLEEMSKVHPAIAPAVAEIKQNHAWLSNMVDTHNAIIAAQAAGG
jgi:hypothetical protein